MYKRQGEDGADANAEEIRMASPYQRPWDTSSTGDYIISTLGGALPSIAGSLGAAAVGGVLGGPWGAGAGALAYNYPQAAGEIYDNQIRVNGRGSPGAAFGYAIPYAGLETAAEAVPVAGIFGKLGKHGVARTIAGRGFRSGLREIGCLLYTSPSPRDS